MSETHDVDLPAGAEWRMARAGSWREPSSEPASDPREALRRWLWARWDREPARRDEFESPAVLVALTPLSLRCAGYPALVRELAAEVLRAIA